MIQPIKISFVLPLFCFLTNYIIAQKSVSVSGQFFNENNIPIEYLEVVIMSENTLIAANITDKEGKFNFNVTPGEYKLLVYSFGNKVYEKNIQLLTSTNLNTITIKNSIQLDEVVVTKEKKLIERKTDRLVFNVENSLAASSGNTLDVLKSTPLLRVTNNSIELIGKDNLLVIIDGRSTNLSSEDLLNFLKSINSESISKIEVMTNPPSKYDAQGNSGIVNVILKKNKRDYFGGNLYSRYQQSTYAKWLAGGSLNYKKNKLSTYVNINSGYGAIGPTENYTIFYPNRTWVSDLDKRNFSKYISYRTGFEYNISKKHTFGMQYSGSLSRPEATIKVNNDLLNATNQQLDSVILTDTRADLKSFYNSLNAHYQYDIDSIGKKLIVDADFYRRTNDETRTFESDNFLPSGQPIQDSEEDALIDTQNNINIYSAKADVELPFENIEFTFGGKIVFSENKTRIDFFDTTGGNSILDPNQSDNFIYKENIQALYFDASKSLSDKISMQAGLRMENTQTEFQSFSVNNTVKNNYLRLFPTLYLTYSINKATTASLSYSKRLDRPSYSFLNPFRLYRTPFSFVEGNPALQPSFTDNLEFTLTIGKEKVTTTTTAYFSKTNNAFESITLVNEDTDTQITSPFNFLTLYNAGISQSINFKISKWWSTYNQAFFYYNKSESSLEITAPSTMGYSGYLSTNNSLKINKKGTIRSDVNFWYQFPENYAIDQAKALYNLDIRFRFTLSQKLSISMQIDDVFKSNSYRARTSINNIRQSYSNYWDNRQLRLTIVYMFFNNKLRVNKWKGSNEDEKNRL